MKIHPDLNQTVHLSADRFEWVASPLPGVERVMLDRVGEEVAVATSIVRYAPGSYFDPHSHALGEEFLVLEGVFSDEHGDFPAGTYVRNPPGTRHKPHSEDGCVIFVKLRQFSEQDTQPVVRTIDPTMPVNERRTLHRFQQEHVECLRVPAGTRVAFDAHVCVRELLLLSGSCTWQQEKTRTLGPLSWIRMRPGEPLRINTLDECLIFTKTRPRYRDDFS